MTSTDFPTAAAKAIRAAIIANRRYMMNGLTHMGAAYNLFCARVDGGFELAAALDELAYRVSIAPASPDSRATEMAFVDSLRAMNP